MHSCHLQSNTRSRNNNTNINLGLTTKKKPKPIFVVFQNVQNKYSKPLPNDHAHQGDGGYSNASNYIVREYLATQQRAIVKRRHHVPKENNRVEISHIIHSIPKKANTI